jgi:aarF domain-containing kinase
VKEIDPCEGLPCAVKVVHPHVHFLVPLDLAIIHSTAQLLNKLPGASWLSLPEEADHFASLMKSQLDLAVEAKNMLRFQHNFRDQWTVDFPTPLYPYVSKGVIIESFVDGVPLRSALSWQDDSVKRKIAESGLKAFLVSANLYLPLTRFLNW